MIFVRSQFQKKVLKPSFSAVDFAEVELMDDGHDARNFSSFLLEVISTFDLLLQ